MRRTFTILVLSLCAALSRGDVMPDARILLDFGPDDRSEWRIVNDGVMGGLSRSSIRRTDDGTAVFSGTLSLENNGGFASVRAAERLDLSGHDRLLLRVRGDGRTYQLRLRTDDRRDGAAYRAEFPTLDGAWAEVELPFADFVPTFRGRILRDAPPLDPAAIRQIGFLLADKDAGAFALEIDRVEAR